MGYYIQPEYQIGNKIDYEAMAEAYAQSPSMSEADAKKIKDIVNELMGTQDEPSVDIQSFIDWLKDDDDDLY